MAESTQPGSFKSLLSLRGSTLTACNILDEDGNPQEIPTPPMDVSDLDDFLPCSQRHISSYVSNVSVEQNQKKEEQMRLADELIKIEQKNRLLSLAPPLEQPLPDVSIPNNEGPTTYCMLENYLEYDGNDLYELVNDAQGGEADNPQGPAVRTYVLREGIEIGMSAGLGKILRARMRAAAATAAAAPYPKKAANKDGGAENDQNKETPENAKKPASGQYC